MTLKTTQNYIKRNPKQQQNKKQNPKNKQPPTQKQKIKNPLLTDRKPIDKLQDHAEQSL
jgi:hypothetical protein